MPAPAPASNVIAPKTADELLHITASGFAALLGPADACEFAAAMLDSVANAQPMLPEEFAPACEAARACASVMQSTYLEAVQRVRAVIEARNKGG